MAQWAKSQRQIFPGSIFSPMKYCRWWQSTGLLTLLLWGFLPHTAQAETNTDNTSLVVDTSPIPADLVVPTHIGPAEIDGPTTRRSTAPSTRKSTMAQVTSVSQLSDIRPTDWAFQALQGLVERYGCIAGYPNQTYRGTRAISRYEFAAGLNTCMSRVTELLNAATQDQVTPADRRLIQKLQSEFVTELANLKNRREALTVQTQTLTQQQFSTTTRLFGQAVFGIQGTNQTNVDFFPRDGQTERTGQALTTFGYNLQLALATSFSGNDLLLTGLQTGNINSNAPNVLTNMGRLGYESATNNRVVVSDLSYRLTIAPNFGLLIGPVGVNPENTFRGINPLEGYGQGAISLFGQRNPILSLGNTSAGVGFDWQIARRASLQGVYSAALANQPTDGVFGERWTAGAQLSLAPTDTVNVGLNYLFSRNADGLINPGIGDAQLLSPFVFNATGFDTHAYGATIAWRVMPHWTIGAWGGWTNSKARQLSGSVQTSNWMVFSAFPDLFAPGNFGGLMIGQPPKITRSTLPDGANFPNFSTGGQAGGQVDGSLHLEAFYRAQLSAKISVTPGLLIIFNPNHNKNNDTLVQGVLRATYQF
ncbi:carbohydrate porin [filamentous cyanobacterium LEGE 11480]|uniref:Carbohydrate porin n=2 Tax=Romeriopsis TaxID=2992131 RepID=A0A928VSI7_9CYAN|nr:carbohydrate porin [Romeriopsis navalis LEGE 11480]